MDYNVSITTGIDRSPGYHLLIVVGKGGGCETMQISWMLNIDDYGGGGLNRIRRCHGHGKRERELIG